MTRRKKMAPRVWRGKKSRGGSGRRQAYSPPPCPPRSTPTAAVRGEPCAPAPRLRQGAHTPDARRRAQRKGPAPKCTCSPRACLCRAAVASRDPPLPSASTLQGQVTSAFRLSEPPQGSPHYLLSGTAPLAFRCQARAGGRATKVTAPGPLPISSIPLPAPKCPLRVSEGGKRGGGGPPP